MERAIITISESGNVNIPDGNIWMSFAELVVLFDVAAPTLKTAIQAIHKIGVIAEHTQHCEVMPYTYWRVGKRKEITYFLFSSVYPL